jgi:hypothetical protein
MSKAKAAIRFDLEGPTLDGLKTGDATTRSFPLALRLSGIFLSWRSSAILKRERPQRKPSQTKKKGPTEMSGGQERQCDAYHNRHSQYLQRARASRA